MANDKPSARQYAVNVRLSDAEHSGLALLRERESLPAAAVLRRLLIREVRAVNEAREPVGTR